MSLKILNKTFTVPSGSPATSYEQNLDLGQEYKEVVGYYAVLMQNGGLTAPPILVSFANAARTVIDSATLQHYIVGDAVAIKDRFYREEPFEINGYIKATLKTPAVTTSDLVVQFIILARKA